MDDIDELLLFFTKNCEMLIEETHSQPQEPLEFKFARPKETFSFQPPFEIEESWMMSLF